MSDTTRASLPEVALGSAVLAADAARDWVKRAATAGEHAMRSAVEVPIDFAAAKVVPRVIDDLMPYLTESVLPRFLDAALPLIEVKLLPRLLESAMPLIEATMLPRLLDAATPLLQEKVLPIVIKDLTESAELRDLITEQSRDVVADAAGDLRESTAAADDRLESGFRRLFHLSSSPAS
ncbi:MAG: hypothetical protein HOV77_08115 [Hamadaea sp.]|uniref:hypothetical protein n=1 Tax=Hamadaea sp. TaxID=2024425 RepID=UPI0018180326|nr:hypothetical protein [Hamadaea sp.]NUT19137.1 hypothetical protein [Hamadaea sp.]